MAVRGEEIELLEGGIRAVAPSKGAFALNMLFRNTAWEVRQGFGQVTQLDSTFTTRAGGWESSTADQYAATWGYTKHLGSSYILTEFGHEQILSVFKATVVVGNEGSWYTNLKPRRYSTRNIWVVDIYDMTTGHRWEEPLYRRVTEGSTDMVPMDKWHGNYETSIDKDYQSWLDAGSKEFFFHEDSGILYFGSPEAGVWAYIPSSFRKTRSMALDVSHRHEFGSHYSESSLVSKVVPSEGLFYEGYSYFTPSEFSNPISMTSANGRMVYASGRTVYFTDVGQPAHIIGDNFFVLNSDEEITAIASMLDNVLIFTPSETWIYRLSDGDLASKGSISKLSDNVGCSGPNAITSVNSAVVWAGRTGVYTLGGELEVNELSGEINPLFSEFITSPLNSYFVQSGWTDMSTDQPVHNVLFESEKAHLSYSPNLGCLFVVFPGQKIAMCLSGGSRWSMWSFESSVAYSSVYAESIVGVTSNILNPWMLCSDLGVFMVGGVDEQFVSDNLSWTVDRSYYIMEYGRGGGLDRSVDDEDRRSWAGSYKRLRYNDTKHETFIIDKPMLIPKGYVFPSGTTVDADNKYFWLPISVVVGEDFAGGVEKLQLGLKFDSAKFTPVFHGDATGQIDFYLPPERAASATGWGWGGGMSVTKRVICVNSGTGATSESGDQFQIYFDGALGPWLHGPYMNLTPYKKEPLIYIPMVWDQTDTDGMDFSITAVSGNVDYLLGRDESSGAQSLTNGSNITAWEQWHISTATHRGSDDVAQPVDWAYLTDSAGFDGMSAHKSRGLKVRMLSHGPGVAADYLEEDWRYGLFNTMVASDLKGWVSQNVDFTGQSSLTPAAVQEIVDKASIRTRISTGSTAVNKTFNTAGVTYGSTNPINKTHGTYLIDDEEVSTIVTSDSVKGEGFSYMLFGFIQNRAQKIILESVRAVFRVIGAKRRGGH